jgi:hypothetical protein
MRFTNDKSMRHRMDEINNRLVPGANDNAIKNQNHKAQRSNRK